MKRISAALIGLLVLTWALPATSNIIEYPIANDLYFGSDTLHVTTTDTKWALGTGDVYAIRIINPASITLSIRIQQGDSVSTIGTYCGISGTWEYPFTSFLYGPPVDSLWVDASASGTVYVEWLEVK